jgi:hypothetical protein
VVATAIEQDLRSWSREVLELPSKHLKGIPPCPYARKAWREDRVLVVESDDFEADVIRHCRDFYGFNKDLIIVSTYAIPDIDDFSAFIVELNEKYASLHCMQFHPDYGAEEAELDFLSDNDWESAAPQEYCMVFIQDLRLVVTASDRLEALGYYAAYPHDEYETLVVNRKRRLTHGNETSRNEERSQEKNDARRHD